MEHPKKEEIEKIARRIIAAQKEMFICWACISPRDRIVLSETCIAAVLAALELSLEYGEPDRDAARQAVREALDKAIVEFRKRDAESVWKIPGVAETARARTA